MVDRIVLPAWDTGTSGIAQSGTMPTSQAQQTATSGAAPSGLQSTIQAEDVSNMFPSFDDVPDDGGVGDAMAVDVSDTVEVSDSD